MTSPSLEATQKHSGLADITGMTEDWKRAIRLFGWLLFLGCAFYVLPVPRPVGSGLDESWRAFLSFGFLARKHFGTEVVFTYGPWGFLIYPRNFPGIFPWVALGRSILSLGCAAGLAVLGVRWMRRPTLRVLWASTILLFAEPTYLVMPLLVLLLWSDPVPRNIWQGVPLHVVACAGGLAANTKFTCFLMLVFLLPPLLLQKQSRWLVITAAGSFIVFWLLAGQSLSTLPAFVSHSAALASDYSTTMVLGELAWPDLGLALLLCGIPVVTTAFAESQKPAIDSFARLAWLCLFEFILFRQAIVRLHVQQLFMGFVRGAFPVGLALVASPDLWSVAGRRRVAFQRFSAAGILVAGTWACLYTMGPLQRGVLKGAPQSTLEMQERRGPKRTDLPASAPGETVGVFPWDLSSALQNGLPLVNLPVIQSYAAYSPRLSALNSQFLEGKAAPARIYFEVGPIDDRYPALEDSFSWRSLLTHYQPSGFQNGFLVLQRSAHPRQFNLQPLFSRDLKPDEALEIPSDVYPVLWAEIRTTRTLFGRLLSAGFRGPRLFLNIETDSGVHRYSFLDQVGRAGFVLSPLVDSTLAMNDLYTPSCQHRSAKPVRKVSLSGPGFGSGFSREIEVRLFAFSTRNGEGPQTRQGN